MHRVAQPLRNAYSDCSTVRRTGVLIKSFRRKISKKKVVSEHFSQDFCHTKSTIIFMNKQIGWVNDGIGTVNRILQPHAAGKTDSETVSLNLQLATRLTAYQASS